MGEARATAQQMALYCRSKNAEPKITSCSLEELAEMYLEEGKAEGVRGDVAWAQSLHETGFFKFGGIVQPGQNNFAGIGALNGNAKGQAATFPDPRTGVRAQIQHLKAYASKEPLVNACVDPRFSLVTSRPRRAHGARPPGPVPRVAAGGPDEARGGRYHQQPGCLGRSLWDADHGR